MINAEQLNEIKEQTENTSFDSAYVKGDPWKGYKVKNEGNGLVVAEVSCGTDAVFIANARQDIPALVAEVERLRAELQDIIAVATEEASSLSYESGYEDIVTVAKKALGINS